MICASVKKAKKKLTLLKIFLNEISKVKYKGRIDDSMYHGKVHCDGRNTGDNGFFFKIPAICKNNKSYK